MIVVTGGAGFIGSNIVKTLNDRGRTDIIVVDNLTNGHKFLNIADCSIADYIDRQDFIEQIRGNKHRDIQAVFHEGACSATTEWNGHYMMKNNYEYSKVLLHHCLEHQIQFIYASSAAVYGASQKFVEHPDFEGPLNVYGYSKLLFDQYVRRNVVEQSSQVVGLRYFNVYGPREQHKGKMSSVAFHFSNQVKETGEIKLFEGSDGYGPGDQRRDFVYVGDIVELNLWLLENKEVSGIFNAGTGQSQTFNEVGQAVIDYHQQGKVSYVPFPEGLKEAYQSFTEAHMSAIRSAGYNKPFKTVQQGVAEYMQILNGTT